MKEVWIGFKCYYDYCNTWEVVEKVFDDEVKALIWQEEFKSTDTEWREYNKFKVEE